MPEEIYPFFNFLLLKNSHLPSLRPNQITFSFRPSRVHTPTKKIIPGFNPTFSLYTIFPALTLLKFNRDFRPYFRKHHFSIGIC